MIFCGLKLTHDSGITIIEDGILKASIEFEKLNNNNRYKIIDDLAQIPEILETINYSMNDIDRIIIDGWIGKDKSLLNKLNLNSQELIQAAPYMEKSRRDDVLQPFQFKGLKIGKGIYDYSSCYHITSHILSSYCTSPFSKKLEPSFILVWDGGMHPRLYYFCDNSIISLGAIFYLSTNIYSIFAQHFGPFKINENVIKDELSIAGKVMAYVAYGEVNPQIIQILNDVYSETYKEAKNITLIPSYPYKFTALFKQKIRNNTYLDEDILTSFHFFIENLLLNSLKKFIQKTGLKSSNLCISGGAGLNIKWNSSIRKSNLFQKVWIPPFSNDSGSSIGASLFGWCEFSKKYHLEWNVYSGPEFIVNKSTSNWSNIECTLKQLGFLIYIINQPFLILDGKAEVGPRSLGNRSILASPVQKEMKDKLNYIKLREFFRPVAPVCLEERSSDIFTPGCKDPYMLFEHVVKEEWRDKIPAVLHSDYSSRLQTINKAQNEMLYTVIKEFEKHSNIPVLCNTSANFKGSGFFPDLHSAQRWGQVDYIWSNGVLYYNRINVTDEQLQLLPK